MEIRVSHTLERSQAAARIREAARKLDVMPAEDGDEGEFGGTMAKDTPLGSVQASWEAFEAEVVVHIVRKPAFLPEGTVRRLLEDGLRDALTG